MLGIFGGRDDLQAGVFLSEMGDASDVVNMSLSQNEITHGVRREGIEIPFMDLRLHEHASVELNIAFIRLDQIRVGIPLRHYDEIIDPFAAQSC